MINIPLRVRNLRKKHDTSDPYKIANDFNIDISFCDTPTSINGLWRRILKRNYIVINKNLNEWQRKAVLCHELAHFLCHRGYVSFCMAGRTFYSIKRYEDEANAFAIELMSDSCSLEKEYILLFLEEGWKK